MKVKRVYNNNVILAEDKAGSEVILMGKGIGYGLGKGDYVTDGMVEKRFEFTGETNNRFKELIKQIHIDFIQLTDEIVDIVKEHISENINDSIYITLTDHIYNLSERMRMGVTFHVALLWNIKQLYPKEYQVGLMAAELIRERLHLKVDEHEASFIALHILNAETNSQMPEVYKMTEIVSEISDIALARFQDTKKDLYSYERFIIHCRLFANNLMKGKKSNADSETNKATLKLLCMQYPSQYECITEIQQFLKQKYSYEVSDNEQLYLMLHLIKLTS